MRDTYFHFSIKFGSRGFTIIPTRLQHQLLQDDLCKTEYGNLSAQLIKNKSGKLDARALLPQSPQINT